MKKYLCLLLILLALLPAFAHAQPAEKKLTLMVYLCGSNLESSYGAASLDLEEMKATGVEEDVTVVVMSGGSRAWKNTLTAETAVITEISGGRSRSIPQETAWNMGEAETLAAFLQSGAENYPAREYALILWDHGGGPVDGVCWDERCAGDHLSLQELDAALAESPFAERKLSWIGFDACLMSAVEVASRVAPYAAYMISSQAEEPAEGWNYSFLRGLSADADGAETGRRIIDAYFEAEYRNSPDLTLACTDLSRISEIEESMDALYRDMAEGLTRESFSRIARLRSGAAGFGKTGTAEAGYDLVDIVSLSDCYAEENPEGAARVRSAVEDAVSYSRANVAGSNGLSAYHPFHNQQKYTEEWKDTYTALDFCPGYTDYISAYGDIMAGEHLVLWNDLNDIRVSEDGRRVTAQISAEQAENLASARLVVLARNLFNENEDTYYRVFTTNDVRISGTTLSAEYDGRSLKAYSESGYQSLTGGLSYQITEENTCLVPLYPRYAGSRPEGKPILAEYRMGGNGTLTLKTYQVYDEMTGAYSSRAMVDLSQYDAVTFLNQYRQPTRNDAGEWLAFDAWREDARADTQWKARYDVTRSGFILRLSTDAERAEELYCAFELTDTQGNTCMTALAPMDGGGVESCETLMEPGTDYPYATSAEGLVSWRDGMALVGVALHNLSDQGMQCSLNNVRINGEPVKGVRYWLYQNAADQTIGAMSSDMLVLCLDTGCAAALSPEDTIRRISGDLTVFRQDDTNYKAGLLLETEIPAAVLLREPGDPRTALEDAPVSVSAVLPALGDVPLEISARAFARPDDSAANARVILNVVLTNTADCDISCLVEHVRINGVPVDSAFRSAEGSGGKDANGRGSIAPGEKAVVSLSFKYEDIARIIPAVSLNEISFDLFLVRIREGESAPLFCFPQTVYADIPLDCFYDEAVALPTLEVLDYGREIGAFNEENSQVLISAKDCDISLQGVFLVNRSFALLLRGENKSEKTVNLCLGQAKLDGQEAVIGRTVSVEVLTRNRRVAHYGLDKVLWEVPQGAQFSLEPGETAYTYVSVCPASAEQREAGSISFRAFLYAAGEVMEGLYLDDITLTTEEAAPLLEGIAGIAPASDYTIRLGEPVPAEESFNWLETQAEGIVPEQCRPVTLRMTPETGEKLSACYYTLFRRIRSDRELAEENINNETAAATLGLKVDFSEGRQWLQYIAIGDMAIGEDGSAGGVFPGMLPFVCAGGEEAPLTPGYISTEDENWAFFEVGNHLGFLSDVFPGVVLDTAIGSIDLKLEPTGTASLEDYILRIGRYPSLAGMIVQRVFLLPADSEPAAFVRYLNEEEGSTVLQQALELAGGKLRFAFHPLEDPENYDVVFFYLTEENAVKCTAPVPLADFPETR